MFPLPFVCAVKNVPSLLLCKCPLRYWWIFAGWNQQQGLIEFPTIRLISSRHTQPPAQMHKNAYVQVWTESHTHKYMCTKNTDAPRHRRTRTHTHKLQNTATNKYSVFVPLVAVKTKVETTCQATSTWRQLSAQIPFKHRFSFDITASHIRKKYHYHLI